LPCAIIKAEVFHGFGAPLREGRMGVRIAKVLLHFSKGLPLGIRLSIKHGDLQQPLSWFVPLIHGRKRRDLALDRLKV